MTATVSASGAGDLDRAYEVGRTSGLAHRDVQHVAQIGLGAIDGHGRRGDQPCRQSVIDLDEVFRVQRGVVTGAACHEQHEAWRSRRDLSRGGPDGTAAIVQQPAPHLRLLCDFGSHQMAGGRWIGAHFVSLSEVGIALEPTFPSVDRAPDKTG